MTTIEFNSSLTSLQKSLETFAKQLTGNEDDAKDLTQETFLKALIYRDKYVNHNNFKAWVYTIMKNIFINNYRRTKKANTIIDQSEDLYYLNISNSHTDTDPAKHFLRHHLPQCLNPYRIFPQALFHINKVFQFQVQPHL